ncbi:MAG: glycosyltransferase family 2 protein [bacterium]|nr:glycosyltransferase family 2 protein [bacterium]
MTSLHTYPLVTVIIPCRNEARYIGACLDSILLSEYPRHRMEIIVADGMSTDGTRAIIEERMMRYPESVRMVNNPKKILASAWNRGIVEGKGTIIMALNAHGIFNPDYILTCVRYLETTDADYVGGVINTRSRASTHVGRAIAFVLSNTFGVGGSRFRTGVARPTWTDTAAFGGYKRDVFKKVGFFNEQLTRSQDFEFHIRMKKFGCKILLIPEMVCDYYIRAERIGYFVRDYFSNGFWVTYPLRYSKHFFSLRHSIPMGFVVALIVLASVSMVSVIAQWLTLGVLVSYVGVAICASLPVAFRTRDMRYIVTMPGLFFLLHVSYGLGSLYGFIKSKISLPDKHV